MSVHQKPCEEDAYITQRNVSLGFVNSLVTRFTGRHGCKHMFFSSPHATVNQEPKSKPGLANLSFRGFTVLPWCWWWVFFPLHSKTGNMSTLKIFSLKNVQLLSVMCFRKISWIIVCFIACYLHGWVLRTCFPLSLYCTERRKELVL